MVFTFLCFLLLSHIIYPFEEGTTTIPPSDLIITGQDKYYLEWKEELPSLELFFPSISPPKPRPVEKDEEKIEIKLPDKEKFVIKEKPPQFISSEALPWIKISLGNYNFFSSSLLLAREKMKRGGSLLIERERLEGFKWGNINDFHNQNKDKIELFIGFQFNEARVIIPSSFFNQEVFLPYEKRNEKRKGLHIGICYETPFYNNLIFSTRIDDEKKDIIKNRGFLTDLSFYFAKKNRLNISIKNERCFEDKNFLKVFLSCYPAKKQWKGKNVLIKGGLGLSYFKNRSNIFNPEVFYELKSRLTRNLIANILLKNYIDFEPFSSIYFKTPYSTASTGIKPESILRLTGGINWEKQRLSLKNSLFICRKANAIEWYKKSDGLYTQRNFGSLFSYGISQDINYSLTNKIDTEFLILLMGLSKDINYTPEFQGEAILKYNGYLNITPRLIFKGRQKTGSGNISSFVILNIDGKRRISEEFEAFFNIENLFNNRYMEMEDYPGERLFLSIGLKIRL